MRMLALAALSFPLLAADAAKPTEAPLTLTEKVAIQSILDKITPLQQQQNQVVAEVCRRLGIPDANLPECRIEQDLSKVYWVKPPAPVKPAPAAAKPSSETTKLEDPKGK